MLTLGSLAFASPWILLGLAALPAIWWLLRISPPLPKRVRFPAIRLLVGLAREEETPAHTPLWLLILRLALAALVVLALANPLWNPASGIPGTGPLLIVVDNGWTSASHWRLRENTLDALIADARRASRPVLVAGTAPMTTPPELAFGSADDAAARMRTLKPLPIAPARLALAARLEAAGVLPRGGAQTIWLSDGLDDGAAQEFSARLAALAGSHGLEIVEPRSGELPLALLPPATEGDAFAATILRASAETKPVRMEEGAAETEGEKPDNREADGKVRALGADGSLLGEAHFTFAAGAKSTKALFDLPVELRNRIARLDIAGENSAGATSLIDERWRRRTVGLVSGAPIERAQPLLSDLYYLQRAIAPYASVRTASRERGQKSEIEDLLSSPLSVLVLADTGMLASPDRVAVTRWVENGGLLLRFAGPRLAGQNTDHRGMNADADLLPVPLRTGGRALGGALSWTNPQRLAPFEAGSPFTGLALPADVTVSRQVLAEPALDLSSHTWARLQDGTPLVTAARRGKGRVVLFHVTANSEWSNLPLSGLFVEMMRRVIALSQSAAATPDEGMPAIDATLAPVRALDGFGRLGLPPATSTPIAAARFDDADITPRHPPGLYGSADSPRALNLARPGLALTPMDALDTAAARHSYAADAELRLRPWMLALALALIVLDGMAALYVTGLFEAHPIRRRRAGLLPVIFLGMGGLALGAVPAPVRAESNAGADAFALRATAETHLGYVLTGDRATDETSRAGLAGLSQILRTRTAFEPGEPMGVDVAHDELAFFPLLYWPMTPDQESPDPETLARIDAYMKNGGTILFDTRDQGRALGNLSGPGTETLRRLLGQLDLPALEPVPEGHVLTKSFYLLQNFPGRWDGGQVWVEASLSAAGAGSASSGAPRSNDGVSSIVIGSNDYAAAWARDEAGRPIFPCEPGGERQRELAERFGINLVMYALTGNYKSDQVHVPALLERLGQ